MGCCSLRWHLDLGCCSLFELLESLLLHFEHFELLLLWLLSLLLLLQLWLLLAAAGCC